jgi:integrase
MNNPVHFGYDPRCQLYSRELKGGKKYYVSYYLPNGVRQRRPCDSNPGEAKKRLRLKKMQLLKGHFDEKDLIKMHPEKKVKKSKDRPKLQEGLQLYLEMTKSRKKPQTQIHDERTLQRYVLFFMNQGCEYVDDVGYLQVQKLINQLEANGLCNATLKSSVAMIKKFFNWFIDEAELVQMKNPVPKKFKLPNRGAQVRDRVVSNCEIQNLLSVDVGSLKNMHNVPIMEIVKFLIFTGARLGEVLHVEFNDFDLETGYWHIQYKPNCPTKYELGWGPKWNKSRDVPLLPEAIQILASMPLRKTEGVVLIRDENGMIAERKSYSANFVFPKRVVQKTASGDRIIRYQRLDSIKKSWKTVRKAAKIQNLQLKDLRTFFNCTLKSTFGLSAKEAGIYIGNSAEVNEKHYTPISPAGVESKLRGKDFSKVIGL